MVYSLDPLVFEKSLRYDLIFKNIAILLFATVFVLSLLPVFHPKARWVAGDWVKLVYAGFVFWHLSAVIILWVLKRRYKSFMVASFQADKNKKVAIGDGHLLLYDNDYQLLGRIPLINARIHHYVLKTNLRLQFNGRGYLSIAINGNTYHLSSLLYYQIDNDIRLKHLFARSLEYEKVKLNIWKRYDRESIYRGVNV